ncbi:hypothetical protein LEP1GSC043_3834 [Leptospira weilii str. Ecochallenge]|uniref:Uncharacterized protein n=1 Tax=Leptospira weilii str. Ecochallenge TaxID=1049986 RepID=N1UDZ4_9LEPT|nr:hypothetical protein LEP1GSC043_3834 [Leptospira weilii str. Ecochallenge]
MRYAAYIHPPTAAYSHEQSEKAKNQARPNEVRAEAQWVILKLCVVAFFFNQNSYRKVFV